MHRRGFLQAGALAALAFAVSACASPTGPRRPATGGDDVLGIARANGLDRFLRAVRTAELTDALSGAGPFTIFAPSDRAFGASSAGRLDNDELRALLAYHVVPGQLTSDFLEGRDVNHTTLLGTSLNIDGTSGLRVNGANVLASDLMASNGVVFILDRVLTPR